MTQFRIKHEGEIIGYCFARTAEKAVTAFRRAHCIADAIRLTAEKV